MIKIQGDKILTTSEYNSDFVKTARKLGGSWNGTSWVFSAQIENEVRKLLQSCYGWVEGEETKTCTLILTFEDEETSEKSGVEIFGRTIARAWGRDSGAKLGDDIVCLDGTFDSAGSVKHWRTEIQGTFKVLNFPISLLNDERVKTGIADGWVVVETDKAILLERKNEIIEKIKLLQEELYNIETKL